MFLQFKPTIPYLIHPEQFFCLRCTESRSTYKKISSCYKITQTWPASSHRKINDRLPLFHFYFSFQHANVFPWYFLFIFHGTCHYLGEHWRHRTLVSIAVNRRPLFMTLAHSQMFYIQMAIIVLIGFLLCAVMCLIARFLGPLSPTVCTSSLKYSCLNHHLHHCLKSVIWYKIALAAYFKYLCDRHVWH